MTRVCPAQRAQGDQNRRELCEVRRCEGDVSDSSDYSGGGGPEQAGHRRGDVAARVPPRDRGRTADGASACSTDASDALKHAPNALAQDQHGHACARRPPTGLAHAARRRLDSGQDGLGRRQLQDCGRLPCRRPQPCFGCHSLPQCAAPAAHLANHHLLVAGAAAAVV